eukprot:4188077-Amphidinium_carterae.1
MAELTMVCAIVDVVMGVARPPLEDPASSDESDPARSESTSGAATGVAGAARRPASDIGNWDGSQLTEL